MKYSRGDITASDFSLNQLNTSEMSEFYNEYYDEYGAQTRCKQNTGEEMLIIAECSYERDEAGRIISIMYKGADGEKGQAIGEWDEAARTNTLTITEETGTGIYKSGIYKYSYDKAGNIISSIMSVNGQIMNESTNTYIAMELPEDYKKPSITDGFYLQTGLPE